MLTFRWPVFEINHIKSKGSIAGYVTVDLTGFSQKAAKATVFLKVLKQFHNIKLTMRLKIIATPRENLRWIQSYHSVT